jgi:hypothetical protein
MAVLDELNLRPLPCGWNEAKARMAAEKERGVRRAG